MSAIAGGSERAASSRAARVLAVLPPPLLPSIVIFDRNIRDELRPSVRNRFVWIDSSRFVAVLDGGKEKVDGEEGTEKNLDGGDGDNRRMDARIYVRTGLLSLGLACCGIPWSRDSTNKLRSL